MYVCIILYFKEIAIEGKGASSFGLTRARDVPGPRAEGANKYTATVASQYTAVVVRARLYDHSPRKAKVESDDRHFFFNACGIHTWLAATRKRACLEEPVSAKVANSEFPSMAPSLIAGTHRGGLEEGFPPRTAKPSGPIPSRRARVSSSGASLPPRRAAD